MRGVLLLLACFFIGGADGSCCKSSDYSCIKPVVVFDCGYLQNEVSGCFDNEDIRGRDLCIADDENDCCEPNAGGIVGMVAGIILTVYLIVVCSCAPNCCCNSSGKRPNPAAPCCCGEPATQADMSENNLTTGLAALLA